MIQDLGERMENKCYSLALKLLVTSMFVGLKSNRISQYFKGKLAVLVSRQTKRSPGRDFTTLSYLLDPVAGFLINSEPVTECLCSTFSAHKKR